MQVHKAGLARTGTAWLGVPGGLANVGMELAEGGVCRHVHGMSRVWRTGGRFDGDRIRKASRSRQGQGYGSDACAVWCGLGHLRQRPVRGFFSVSCFAPCGPIRVNMDSASSAHRRRRDQAQAVTGVWCDGRLARCERAGDWASRTG